MVDVPISITALSTDQLATANVQNLADIAQLTPGLRFDTQTFFFQPSIRGIGTGITTSGGGSNVGIYIDGFYSPNPVAADLQFLNITNVQVLKGPQGTLFGHNTTGGAILLSTAEPSMDTHAEVTADYGSFGAQRYQAYATTGIADVAAVDLEGIFSKGSGFLTNIVNGDSDVGAYQNYTLRTGLKFQLGEKVSVLARFTHSGENDPTSELTNSNTDTTIDPTTGKPWGVQTYTFGPYTTNPNQVAELQPVFVTSQNNIAQLTLKADLDFADFTSYTQYREENTNASENLAQAAVPIFNLGLPIFDITESQEFLFTSKPGPALQWTAGGFYFTNRDAWQTYIDTATQVRSNAPLTAGGNRLGGSGTETESFAEFGDLTYELTPQWFLTVGARFSHDNVINAYYNPYFSNQEIPVPSIDGNKVTPRAVVRYKPTDESSVYASFSEGYKAAIIDVGGSCQDPPAFKCNPIKPEDVDAYEVGYKFESHGFSNDIAAYYYNYKNLQVSEFLGNAEAYIVNAAQSKIWGFDEQLHYDWSTYFKVDGGAAYTHARYSTFGGLVNGQVVGAPIYATCPGAPVPNPAIPSCSNGAYAYVNTSTVLHNVPMQHVPEWTATLAPRLTTGKLASGEYAVSANIYYSSSFYFSPSGTQFYQPGYATVGVRTQWTDPSARYWVALYGENLNNERYRTQVQYNSYGMGASWNAPATWGIELGAKF
ncbi:MAG TPA: TonB-dependent receptor [Steroidobacteraceae bacterium]|nr:TonB-dependent receptor [Steroidobacteraceae bacterium]